MRGNIKVMVSADGKTRVQEERGETIKVYSHDEWEIELKKRNEESIKEREKADKKDKVVDVKPESNGIKAEEKPKAEVKLGAKPKSKPKAKAKK